MIVVISILCDCWPLQVSSLILFVCLQKVMTTICNNINIIIPQIFFYHDYIFNAIDITFWVDIWFKKIIVCSLPFWLDSPALTPLLVGLTCPAPFWLDSPALTLPSGLTYQMLSCPLSMHIVQPQSPAQGCRTYQALSSRIHCTNHSISIDTLLHICQVHMPRSEF